MKIAYFVHDLNDAAVARRVTMFLEAGAQVTLAGFYRGDRINAYPPGVEVTVLGQSFNAKLAARAGLVLRNWLKGRELSRLTRDADVVVARSLEALTIAQRAAAGRPLVYECLDLHRLMMSHGLPGRVLRRLERWLLSKSRLLIVSSPAFHDRYFAPVQGFKGDWMLLENKPLALEGPPPPRQSPTAGPVWRIGWFGMIRCRKSLRILSDLAAASNGQIEVVIAGRPSYNEFDDFDAQVAAAPQVSFLGAYKPDDLPALYGGVHFSWAIDYFEEGLNSSLLLPNRLYEGGLFGAVSIAQADVETGRWLARHDTGVLVDDPATVLPAFFRDLTPAAYDALRQAAAAVPVADVRATHEDCAALVARLEAAARA